jgi:hypothetical protein
MATAELVMSRSGVRFPSPAPSVSEVDGTSCAAGIRSEELSGCAPFTCSTVSSLASIRELTGASVPSRGRIVGEEITWPCGRSRTGGGRVLSSPRCTDPFALLNLRPERPLLSGIRHRARGPLLSFRLRLALPVHGLTAARRRLSPIGLDPGFTGRETSSTIRHWRRHTRTIGCRNCNGDN